MAETEKKTTKKTTATKSTAKPKEDAKVKALEAEIEELKKLIMTNAMAQSVPQTPVYDTEMSVPVRSLCLGTLTLTTQAGGKGRAINFERFGQVRDLSYSELKDAVQANSALAEGLAYYIEDPEIVKKLRLQPFYDEAITSQEMMSIFECDVEEFMRRYNRAAKHQKRNIVALATNAVYENQKIDMNILDALGKAIDRKLM